MLNARLERALPVLYANQFALGGGNLSLIRSQTNYSVAPMGYVFEGFSDWAGSRLLPVWVESPVARAYDREVPYVIAAAALSADGRTLRVALVNNAETAPLEAVLRTEGQTVESGRLRRLSADSPDANNETDPEAVRLREDSLTAGAFPFTLTLPPHSVTWLTLSLASAPASQGP